jgi:lipoprotein NlpD
VFIPHLGFIIPVSLIVFNLTGCAGFADPSYNSVSIYTVQRGDTPQSVAKRFGITFAELIRLNDLSSPYRLRVGQVLRVPFPPPEPVIQPLGEMRKHSRVQREMSSNVKQIQSCKPHETFYYPTQRGTMTRGIGGLDILGQTGQQIYAIASGQVVYSGKGVKGYPNLVIVKHENHLLSIYAHNARLHVSQGMWVKAGQPLAEMGMNAKHQGMLRFELNCHGKRVDPMLFFPH